MQDNYDYQKIIYLDNNATTRVAPEVLEAMLPFFADRYGNPSSMYRFGGRVKRYVEEAREQVAALIGAQPREIIFTSCGTESDNMAIKGFCQKHKDGAKIITSAVEHPAVRNTARFMNKETGAALTELSVDSEGMLSLDELGAQEINSNTLVSIMWANNETGVTFPIDKIADTVKSRGGYFHCDAVQAAGKVNIDVKKIPVDMLAISGHKLHAPKGVGAAYVRGGGGHKPARLFTADIRKTECAAGRKMLRISWDLVALANLRLSVWKRRIPV